MTYNSTFKDRAGQAAEAKQKALEKFKSRPPVDEKAAAERIAAAQRREDARAEKAAAKKAEAEAKAAEAAAKAARHAADPVFVAAYRRRTGDQEPIPPSKIRARSGSPAALSASRAAPIDSAS